MSNADVKIVVSLNDGASADLKKSLSDATTQTEKLNKGATQAGTALEHMADKGMLGGAALKGVVSDADKLLGRTIDTNGRLREASGRFVKMGEQAKKAAHEVDKIGKGLDSRIQTAGSRMRELASTAGSVAVGGMLAGTVVKAKYQELAQYDSGVRDAANKSFSERDGAGRADGAKEITALIKDVVNQHGGTADQALTAYIDMAGRGIKHDEIKNLLGDVMHYRTAGQVADTSPLVQTQQAIKNFGVDEKKGLEWSYVAGKEGSNEQKNTAQALPTHLANAANAGMGGDKDIKDIFALQQAAMLTSGNADAANNNVTNLLAKLSSKETADDFAKKGIDFNKDKQDGIVSGKNALQVYAEDIMKIASKNKNFTNATAELKANTDPSKEAMLLRKQSAALGEATGFVASDLQESMAAIAYISHKDYMDKIRGVMDASHGTDESAKDKVNNQAGLEEKGNKVGNAKFFGEWAGLEGVMQSIGDGLGSVADWFNGYETAAAVAGAGTFAATALGAGGSPLWLRSLFTTAPAAATTAAVGVEAAGTTAVAAGGSIAAPLALLATPIALLAYLGTSLKESVAAVKDPKDRARLDELGSIFHPDKQKVSDATTPAAGAGSDIGASIMAWLGGSALGGKLTQPAVSPALSTAANPDILRASTAMLTAANAAQAPSGQALIQSDAQLQQVNAQMSQLVQVANNAPVQQSLQAVQAGISQLNAKNYTMTATIPVYIDGSMVSQSVNKINANNAYRNGVG